MPRATAALSACLLFGTACAAPIVAVAPAPAPPPGVPLAITIDDLPFVGPTARGESRLEATRRLIGHLVEHRVPVAGFVVCGRAERQPQAFEAWRTATGVTLGNHSGNHDSVDKVGPEAWLKDVAACQGELTKKLAEPPRWFRYPYLQTGATAERRSAAAAGLEQLGLLRAPVSMDTSDWLFVTPYVRALATDEARAEAIVTSYVEHLRRVWRHYRQVARQRVGQEIPQVLLLHANAILADALPRVLDMLRTENARFVGLDEALAHPVYAQRDDWVDPVGASWLYRIAPVDKPAWGWDRGQQAAIRARWMGAAETEFRRIGPDTAVRRLQTAATGTGAASGQLTPVWVVRHDKPDAANAIVYRTQRGIPVLVDTPWTGRATQDVLDWAAVRFGRPVAAAIVGHFRAVDGVRVLRAADIPTIGSRETARLIRERLTPRTTSSPTFPSPASCSGALW